MNLVCCRWWGPCSHYSGVCRGSFQACFHFWMARGTAGGKRRGLSTPLTSPHPLVNPNKHPKPVCLHVDTASGKVYLSHPSHWMVASKLCLTEILEMTVSSEFTFYSHWSRKMPSKLSVVNWHPWFFSFGGFLRDLWSQNYVNPRPTWHRAEHCPDHRPERPPGEVQEDWLIMRMHLQILQRSSNSSGGSPGSRSAQSTECVQIIASIFWCVLAQDWPSYKHI